MDFADAKAALKKLYLDEGFVLSDEQEMSLAFAANDSGRMALTVPEEEIADYGRVADEVATARNEPVTTSILTPIRREQYVDIGAGYRSFFTGGPRNNRVLRFGDPEGSAPFVEIGQPSATYINYFRMQASKHPFIRERLIRRMGFFRTQSVKEAFSRFSTIRILNYPQPWDEAALADTTRIFEGCLFELSYLKGISLELTDSWPVTFADRRSRRPFEPRKRSPALHFPLKPLRYEEAVVRFYRRGISTDDFYIAFISFYHVLEYFFITVSDDLLYRQLGRVVNDPSFSSRKPQLDRLISTVEDHRRTADETEMLKGVLSEYVDEGELADFIRRYEEHAKERIYTEKSECFGYELEKITIRDNHVFGPIAKRIKTIRNALVHSSDRYDRKDRYVPGETAHALLQREMPLLKFIAEKVIVATAEAASIPA